MATIINTGLLEAGLRSEFYDALGKAPSVWQDLATVLKSDKDAERYAFLGSVPQMREWGTGRLARGLITESYSVKNLKYESTLQVDRDELSDDQTGQIKLRTRELAERAAGHKDALLANLLVNGGEAGFLSYDGKTFFATDHESGNSGQQSNSIGFDVVDKDAPTTPEFRSAVAKGIAQLLSLKDDQAEPMNNAGTGLVAVVPPSMYITALESMSATLVASTTNVLAGAARVLAFPRLTAKDTFYLLKTDVSVRPFVLQDREPIEFGALEQNSDTGFMREVFLYGVRARYAMTYGYWQRAIRITLANAG